MERAELQQLFGDNPVEALCREALENGACFEIWDEETPASRVASIYARRERRASNTGQPSIGFPEAVQSLKQYAGEYLRIGYVDARPLGGYYMQVFLNSDGTKVVACLGVRPSST